MLHLLVISNWIQRETSEAASFNAAFAFAKRETSECNENVAAIWVNRSTSLGQRAFLFDWFYDIENIYH